MAAAALVPELLVTDLEQSLTFWRDACGFVVMRARLDEGFVLLRLGAAEVMLEERGRGRNRITGPLERPFGRGLNLEIHVDDLDQVLDSLRRAQHVLFMEPEVKAYRIDTDHSVEVRQFLVQDPDGYLLRFQASL